MALFSENFPPSEHVLPPTAPTLESPATGLLEDPGVFDADLQKSAEALSRQWEMVSGTENGLSERITRLKMRLAGDSESLPQISFARQTNVTA